MNEVHVDIDRYLARIAYEGPVSVSASCLAALQTAHMMSVPFENLHVFSRLPVSTSLEWSYRKVVEDRRGGWCFELNGAFAALLEAIGFPVRLMSARVFDDDLGEFGEFGPPLDHLCLLVDADDEQWLVDVGFGDSSLLPLRLDIGVVQDALPRTARLVWTDDATAVRYEELSDGRWVTHYAVDLAPRTLADFQSRSDALWAGAGSGYFTSKPFATRAVDPRVGRVWLLRDRLKRAASDGSPPTEVPLTEAEWPLALAEWFGMSMPDAGYRHRS
jgi:N-hydroxyarylamine O-acetyltransferase